MIRKEDVHCCDFCAPGRDERMTALYRGINGVCICHECLGRLAARFGGRSEPGIIDCPEVRSKEITQKAWKS